MGDYSDYMDFENHHIKKIEAAMHLKNCRYLQCNPKKTLDFFNRSPCASFF